MPKGPVQTYCFSPPRATFVDNFSNPGYTENSWLGSGVGTVAYASGGRFQLESEPGGTLCRPYVLTGFDPMIHAGVKTSCNVWSEDVTKFEAPPGAGIGSAAFRFSIFNSSGPTRGFGLTIDTNDIKADQTKWYYNYANLSGIGNLFPVSPYQQFAGEEIILTFTVTSFDSATPEVRGDCTCTVDGTTVYSYSDVARFSTGFCRLNTRFTCAMPSLAGFFQVDNFVTTVF